MRAPIERRPDFTDLMVGVACGLAMLSTLLVLGAMPFLPRLAGARDFIIYWATGQQLAHHGNPYDPAMMRQFEHAAGFPGAASLVNYMRNPPWALPLTLPLGFVGARAAALPWSLLMLGLLILSVRILWKMFGRPGTHLEWLGYCFPPALLCVIMGQTSLLVLLGLVLFLRLHRTRPYWAGAALWLCTLKPHLLAPFGVALLVWIVVSKNYRVLGGLASALAASCALTEAIDPAAWGQYLHWARTSGISNEFLPCVSVALRNAIDPNAGWIAFVPCAVGCAWTLVWCWRRREQWDWLDHGLLVVVVSVLVAPYCWYYDQSLALPALLYGAARTQSRMLLAVLAGIYLVVTLQPLYSKPESALYVWPAVAWLVWYVFPSPRWPVSSPQLPVHGPGSPVSGC
ncbi:MAG: glycosyltransferase 87 family protein [Acidobacteriaceae bacterium]